MDTKQIEYILKIAEEKNITHAANKLFITQSALNQQLIKLENELGTPLFHRSRTNWRPTEAGEIYIKRAKEIIRIKQEAYQMIYDCTSGKRGRLSVGFTPGRGIAIFTAAYKEFRKQYPHIVIEPVEMNVRELQQMIGQGDLDIAFVTLSESDKTEAVYETFFEEELVLAVPSLHPLCQNHPEHTNPYPIVDIKSVQYEPFVFMNRASTMRSLVDRIFAEAGIIPQILFETRNNKTIISMIQANMCCGIVPYYYTTTKIDGVTFFSLPSHPTWQFAVTYRKGRYLSRAAHFFIECMRTNSTLL